MADRGIVGTGRHRLPEDPLCPRSGQVGTEWNEAHFMSTRSLGRTGLQVPPLCLGTMTFGLQCDEQTSYAILDRAIETGITFMDTADVYPLGGTLETVGRTEEIIGRWMRDRG